MKNTIQSITKNLKSKFFLLALLPFFCFTHTVFADTASVDLQIPLYNSSGQRVEKIDTCKKETTTWGEEIMECGGIATYIKLVFEWLTRAAGILAVMMIVWGGVIWLTAAGNTGKVHEAQKIIGNSVTGLVLMLGSVTLLGIINPSLVDLSALKLSLIKGKPLPAISTGPAAGSEFEKALNDAVNEMTNGVYLPGTAISAITPASGGSIAIPTTGTSALSLNGTAFNSVKATGNIIYSCVPEVGGCSCPARDSGRWDKGVSDTPTPGIPQIDRRILGAIVFIEKVCGNVTITAFNEQCGHRGPSHTAGKAVDISGNICGDAATACSEKQVQLIKKLQELGYVVGTPDATRCGGFNDPPNHFHIQVP